MLLRVACGYRTVSAAALQVITATLPIHLLVEQRKITTELEAEKRTPAEKRGIRSRLVDRWQAEWELNREVAGWTRELIPNIRDWIDCQHKTLSYEFTQILTAHGCFHSYTYRIGKEDAPTCIYCENEDEDTVEHTVVSCRRWNEERMQLKRTTGGYGNTRTLIAKMMQDNEIWKVGWIFIKTVVSTKETEGRRR